MNSSLLIRASRFLSWALRHDPNAAGITLDEAGWASVASVMRAFDRRQFRLNRDDLKQILAEDEKGRFSFTPDGHSIRANYAHSIAINLNLPASTPPNRLYHGTARHALDAIKRLGLLRQQRQFVHLTSEVISAFSIGERYGAPVVIPVDAARMHAEGHVFYHGAGTIWMTASVPPHYLNYAELIFCQDKK